MRLETALRVQKHLIKQILNCSVVWERLTLSSVLNSVNQHTKLIRSLTSLPDTLYEEISTIVYVLSRNIKVLSRNGLEDYVSVTVLFSKCLCKKIGNNFFYILKKWNKILLLPIFFFSPYKKITFHIPCNQSTKYTELILRGLQVAY